MTMLGLIFLCENSYEREACAFMAGFRPGANKQARITATYRERHCPKVARRIAYDAAASDALCGREARLATAAAISLGGVKPMTEKFSTTSRGGMITGIIQMLASGYTPLSTPPPRY